jgi:hypothetical protein
VPRDLTKLYEGLDVLQRKDAPIPLRIRSLRYMAVTATCESSETDLTAEPCMTPMVCLRHDDAFMHSVSGEAAEGLGSHTAVGEVPTLWYCRLRIFDTWISMSDCLESIIPSTTEIVHYNQVTLPNLTHMH